MVTMNRVARGAELLTTHAVRKMVNGLSEIKGFIIDFSSIHRCFEKSFILQSFLSQNVADVNSYRNRCSTSRISLANTFLSVLFITGRWI